MTDTHVWFITGRGRGRGVSVATAALAAGHTGVATGRTPQTGRTAIGGADDLPEVR
jgi:NAD(P)-dependent dehydrogenase (short-subunit alcohol dehydrogenase family)